MVSTRSKTINDQKEIETNSDSETEEETEKIDKEKPFVNYDIT